MGLIDREALANYIGRTFRPHLGVVSSLLFFVGVAWLFVFPQLVKNNYMSENALMPSSAATQYQDQDFDVALQMETAYASWHTPARSVADCWGWVQAHIEETLQMPIYRQSITVSSFGGNYNGANLYTILRAYKSDGKESLLLTVNYHGGRDISGVSVAVSLMRVLQRARWMHKDIVFVILDANAPMEAAAQAFASEYHGVSTPHAIRAGPLQLHGGAIQAGLSLDLLAGGVAALQVSLTGTNGQLPNLDVFNTLYYSSPSERMPLMLRNGSEFSRVDEFLTQFSFIPAEYRERLLGFAHFMQQQASALPGGPSGVFLKYRIDAITLRGVGGSGVRPVQIDPTLVRTARLTEATLRCLNNMLEHLHQSFYFYLLPVVGKYFSYGDYILPLAIMLFATTLRGIKFYIDVPTNSRPLAPALMAFAWCHVVCAASYLLLWALAAYGPEAQMSLAASASSWIIGTGALAVVFILVYRIDQNTAGLLKSFAALEIGCVCFSLALLNYSVALMCLGTMGALMAYVLIPSRRSIVAMIQLCILALASPPGASVFISVLQGNEPFAMAGSWLLQARLLPTILPPFVVLFYGPACLACAVHVTTLARASPAAHVKTE